MKLTIRKPLDDAEREFAQDENRWFSERDWPDDYVGSSTEDVLIADVGGLRCIIKIEVPGDGPVDDIRDALLQLSK